MKVRLSSLVFSLGVLKGGVILVLSIPVSFLTRHQVLLQLVKGLRILQT